MFIREGTVFNSKQDERLYSHAEVVKVIDSVLESIRTSTVRYLSENNCSLVQESELKSRNNSIISAKKSHLGEPTRQIPLTIKQREVLYYLALGLTIKEIGYKLHRSPKTIAAHRAQIMERLGLRDLVGLVIYAMRQGIINVSDYNRRDAKTFDDTSSLHETNLFPNASIHEIKEFTSASN